jgi:hypothetical protein
MKVIAIDYDNTYTADPPLWDMFVDAAKKRGHLVVCVTYRDAKLHPGANIPGVETFYTSAAPKAEFMAREGLAPSIWIDDAPHTIVGAAPAEVL